MVFRGALAPCHCPSRSEAMFDWDALDAVRPAETHATSSEGVLAALGR